MKQSTTSPHISVVIPVYNEAEYISKCLDALSVQTIRPDVIYIIDNNSTDDSIEIAEKYASVVVLKQAIQGICATVQKGFDEAVKHDGYMLRCDADSRPPADWVQKIVTTFDTQHTVSSITGPGEVYETSSLLRFLIRWLYMKSYFVFVVLAMGETPLFGSNMAIRARVWKDMDADTHLIAHQDIHDDIDISFHIKGYGNIHYDRSLVMPISARPFYSVSKMIQRYIIGFRSITIHWPHSAPWVIYKEKIKRVIK